MRKQTPKEELREKRWKKAMKMKVEKYDYIISLMNRINFNTRAGTLDLVIGTFRKLEKEGIIDINKFKK